MICGNTYLDREKYGALNYPFVYRIFSWYAKGIVIYQKIRKRIFPNIREDAAFNKCYISVWQCIVHPPKAKENMKEQQFCMLLSR